MRESECISTLGVGGRRRVRECVRACVPRRVDGLIRPFPFAYEEGGREVGGAVDIVINTEKLSWMPGMTSSSLFLLLRTKCVFIYLSLSRSFFFFSADCCHLCPSPLLYLARSFHRLLYSPSCIQREGS